jgi:hypothetical protein
MHLFLSLGFLIVGTAQAGQSGEWAPDVDQNSATWQEAALQLPAIPKPENLIAVKLDASTRNTLLIDTASLALGEDGVVRYSAMVRSPTGAENVSFEGLRCETGERKLYAFGRTSGKDVGTWAPNRYAKWQPIQARLAGGYHRELFFHYFCTVNTRRDVATLLHLLKSGGIYEQ